MYRNPWYLTWRGFAALIAAITLAMVPLLMWGHSEDVKWAKHCAALGGRVDSVTKTGTVWTGKAAGVSSSTTDFCLSPDGRILEIR